jgi:hypothetical protein
MTENGDMGQLITRRQLVAIVTSGIASFAGCQSIVESEVPIVVNLINVSSETQEVFLELTKPTDDDFQIGRVLSIDSGVAMKVDLTVPKNTYKMTLSIDDVVPRPERSIQWKIGDEECMKERYWVIQPSNNNVEIKLAEPACDNQ